MQKTTEPGAGRRRLQRSGIHKFTFRQQHSAQGQVIITARVIKQHYPEGEDDEYD